MLTRKQVWEIVDRGLFVTVWFIKKDGSVRVLNGRKGVEKFTVGGTRTTDPNEYLILWETGHENGRDGYRNVSWDRLIAIAAEGKVYFVE